MQPASLRRTLSIFRKACSNKAMVVDDLSQVVLARQQHGYPVYPHRGLQEQIFRLLGHSKEAMEEQFGHLLSAL